MNYSDMNLDQLVEQLRITFKKKADLKGCYERQETDYATYQYDDSVLEQALEDIHEAMDHAAMLEIESNELVEPSDAEGPPIPYEPGEMSYEDFGQQPA